MKNTLTRCARVQLAAVLCLTLGLQACNRDTPEKFIASGKSYLEKRDYPAAAIQFKNAVQKAPNNGEARYLLGITLQQEDDPGAAEIELRKALSAGYAPDLAYPALVRVLLEQGQFEKALSEAEGQHNTQQAKAELSALAGDAQFGLGKVNEARAAYSVALALEPTNDTATLGMAKVAASERDSARANQLVDEVLARSPSSRDALLLKAALLLADKRGKDAAQAYAKAIDLRPRALRLYLSLIPLLLREQDLMGARERVDALKKLAPRALVTLYLDALVAYSQNDRPRAHDAIQSALRVSPDFVPAMLLAGAIAHDSGNYAEAEEYLRRVVAATPNQAYPRRVLVSIYLRSGQLDRAQEALEPLLQLAPNDTTVLSLAGEVALANRDIAKAAEYYKRALAIDPKNALMRTRLGETRLAAGDTQNAIQDLEAASSEAGSQGHADVALVVVHLNRKELDQAQAASDALTKKQPNNPLTYNLAGLVRLAKGDQAGARKNFEHALELQPTYFPAARNLSVLDIQDRNPAAAKQRYESILAKDAKNEQSLLALFELLQATGAPTAEIDKAIDRAIAANPGSPRANLVKIKYLLQRGDAKGALAVAEQARAAFPQDLQVLAAHGQSQLAAGENDQAIATFGKLASLTPKAPAPLLAQGQAYASMKDWSNARKVIQKAIELQPKLVQAWAALVRVGIGSGRFEEARAAARTIQKQWPTEAVGYLAEAEVLTAQMEPAQAERILRDAVEKTKSPQLVIRLYSFLNNEGRKQDAEAFAAGWAAKNPGGILVDLAAGELSMQRKDYTEAAKWYRSAVQAQPNNVVALNNLAWALGQLKDPSALEYGEKALSLAPNAGVVLDTVGWLYVERGDLTRGIELLTKAQSLAPNAPAIQLNLAKALIKAGQGKAARQQLEVLAKLPVGSPVKEEAEKLLLSL
jgi:putative PEP-CTERM system TPR-repeat lipoprotein